MTLYIHYFSVQLRYSMYTHTQHSITCCIRYNNIQEPISHLKGGEHYFTETEYHDIILVVDSMSKMLLRPRLNQYENIILYGTLDLYMYCCMQCHDNSK